LKTVGDFYGIDGTGELLRTIIDRAIRIADGERGALLLAGPGSALETAIAREAGGRDLQPQQVLPRSLPWQALQTGHAVVLTDAEEPGQKDEATPSVMQGRLRTVLCIPLPGAERGGVLYVDSSRPAEEFGAADLAALEALAAHGRLAIERAGLRQEH